MRNRPHQVAPSKETIRVILAYKNFAANRNISHIGLGVAAANNSQVLTDNNIWAHVYPILGSKDLAGYITASNEQAAKFGEVPISHVVISAPWIPIIETLTLVNSFPQVQFIVVSHSNVGFLQADPNGIAIFRGILDSQMGLSNLHAAGNSEKFAEWVKDAYGQPCVFLPNMYSLDYKALQVGSRKPSIGSPVRVGCFGATRPLKNILTAAAAAIEFKSKLGIDVEFWVSGGRVEGGGTIQNALKALTDNIPGFKVVENNWQTWPQFRKTIRHMDILLQLSYTESYNLVTADGVAEGIPSVVSDSIPWAPESWQVPVDEPGAAAMKMIDLLYNPLAVKEGLAALKRYNEIGIGSWENFLLGRRSSYV